MVRTVAQNDSEQFKDCHFTAIMGRDYPVKGSGVVALQEGDNMLTDAFAVCRHRRGCLDIAESGSRHPHVIRAHTAVLWLSQASSGNDSTCIMRSRNVHLSR